jgi:esterase/lipase superfamily enzyme
MIPATCLPTPPQDGAATRRPAFAALRRAAGLAALLLLAACAVTPAPAPVTEARVVPVFYGTNRIDTGATKPENRYGDRAGPLGLGLAQVSIPEDHAIGELEEPGLLTFSEPNPREYVVLLSLEALDANGFLRALSAELRRSPRQEALIFVHGINNDFGDAIRRSAQFANDLDWPGVTIAFAWPATDGLLDFDGDRQIAETAAPALAELLDLVDRAESHRDHMVAHSMGGRIAVMALSLVATQRDVEGRGPMVDELVLAAPEIPAAMLQAEAPGLDRVTGRTTLYVSRADRALLVAGRYTGDDSAGDAANNVLLLPGIETIDATEIRDDFLGHSYYRTNRTLLADMHQLLTTGLGPDRRFGLVPVTTDAGTYWVFRP